LDAVIEPDVHAEQTGEELHQIEPLPIREENVDHLELGPEVQGTLPFIKEHDHPYYPPPSHLPPSRRDREDEGMSRRPSRKLVKKNRGDGTGGGLRIAWRKMLRQVKKIL
jgi:hypothetical protein